MSVMAVQLDEGASGECAARILAAADRERRRLERDLIAKYADADTATDRDARCDAELVVEVADDGVGGADPADGSGLRGLADRVEALGGRLHVWSAPATGTTVRAEIPVPPLDDRSA
jgi:glucose-6-phosphate-specific signal transduction histidine kinase